MAIRLLGIKKYIPTRSATSEATRMAENYLKTHTDEEGVISDPQVFYEAIGALSPFADELKVANKIADYKNRALKLIGKIEEAENNRTLFSYKLETTLSEVTRDSIADPRGLIFKLTDIYMTALDEFDEKILGEAMKNLEKGQKLPQGLIDYRDSLSEKTNTLVNLANSYMTIDPKTELPGPSNADAYGVMIKTNPQTGAIVNLELQEVTSLDKAPSGYTKTDARYGRLPIYLNTYLEGTVAMGRLGNSIFKGGTEEYTTEAGETKERKLLKLQGGVGIGGFLERQFRRIGKETAKGVKELQQEFPLSAVPFNFFDIPPESVVKAARDTYYYFDKKRVLWKFQNAELLKRYLSEIRKDPNDVDNKFYFGHPDFITQYFKVDENGKGNLIDENFFEGIIRPGEDRVDLMPSIQKGVTFGLPKIPWGFTLPEIPAIETYTAGKKVKPSPEWTPEGYEVPKIIEKGAKIFKRFMPEV